MKTIVKQIAFIFLISVFFLACKKPAGEGGSSVIRGKIWVKDYPGPSEYGGMEEDVYIIYGDEASYGDRVKTNYDGTFEFKYLRKGKYTVYVYSDDITGTIPSAKEVIKQEVTIDKNKQEIEVPVMTINKY